VKRREFLEKASYGAAGMAVPTLSKPTSQEKKSIEVVRYGVEIEVYEVGPETRCHKKGEKFVWPKDMGNICHWLASALDPVCTSLAAGAIYPWKYAGTPYEKVIDPDGVTTEYIRCPDPSQAGIVVKITRTFKGKRTIQV
jgi:uncharacterized repeat protein (TIGR04076 family)